ncbi:MULTISPECIES: ParB/RepB/Spo0J family partition protein [Kurthia]|uniref:ParB/RepB/Spo0J family partition protein n=1 Tax=Kurthia TaxID=1649 RepID=UPI001D2ED8FE|nr:MULTISPECIES: ParB/RepB/Spo0J family partition protein [Kurthia]MCA9725301.1 ParB/RepB/Spo0J family partition protein [Kurthia sp.]MEB7773195.1 ParB/RepB/Spo0J family partition protein [Kurthia gibsonii]WIL38697.1 ParB/RepB/Spo0J family partition protein [Kurthia sp. YJT4]
MAKGLGKGLNALFNTDEVVAGEKVEKIPVRDIKPNPYQPRKEFKKEALEELAESIKEHGVLQPVVVRKQGKGYELVVGERRFRAAKMALQKEIPAIIREFDQQQMMELAILENLQREDLTALEEAEAYQNLMENLNFTQEKLAQRLGKSRPYIANQVRLLSLPKDVQQLIAEQIITPGHGRTLLGLKRNKLISQVAAKVVQQGLNVRQLEALVQQYNEDVSRETKEKPKKDLFLQEREDQLRDVFGTSVVITKGKKKGKIEIEFFSEDDLERILEILEK